MMMRPSFVTALAFLTLSLLLIFPLSADGADPEQHADRAASLRVLQADTDLGGLTGVCNEETGGVNFAENQDDLLSSAVCTCSEENNLEDLSSSLGGGDGQLILDIDLLNEILSNLSVDITWSCANGCATCNPANNVCGIITADYDADFSSTQTDLTVEDLFSGELSPDAGIGSFLQGSQMYEICMEYVSGGDGLAGTTACLGQTLGIEAIVDVNATEQPCMLSYQDQECDSCVLQQDGCWVADCSNHGEPVVNSCTGTGMDGIFQVLAFYTGDVDRNTLTVGTCDASSTSNGSGTGTNTNGDTEEANNSAAGASSGLVLAAASSALLLLANFIVSA